MVQPLTAEMPRRIGPYRLLGVLGRGGMGIVYQGEHGDSGQSVALKTVHTAAGAMQASIRREVHALSRLRHPGVVRIVAQGTEDGLPWYAMEFLEGQTLRGYLKTLWPRSPAAGPGRPLAPPLKPILGLVRRLCDPLAFVHGNGLVHCDLKPDNIFIQPGGTPVLVDFGIAARFGGARGRESLEVMEGMQGSDAYMAPEQIRGEFVDARVDLYALGCILYELLTGRPPFEPGGGSLLSQHLRRRPVPPSERVESIPGPLDELVLRLLAKRPQERIGYADDVAMALASLGAESSPKLAEPSGFQAYLYRPQLAGRAGALRQLWSTLADLEAGCGGKLLITGESGVGKTRLALELANEASRRGLVTITGECVALEAAGSVSAAPLHPLRPLLLAVVDRCREQGAEEAERLLGPRGRVLAPYVSELAQVSGQQPWPEPPTLPAPAGRARVLSALRETLLAFAAAQPLILVLDDLQWADELSAAILQEMTITDLTGRGLLVVGTCRTEEMDGTPQSLLATNGWNRLELERLEAGEVGSMVCDMLALREPPAPFVDFLQRQSGGNPFFVAEYLRAAMGERLLFRDGAGHWRLTGKSRVPRLLEEALPLPHAIAEIIQLRLQSLGAPGRNLAGVAAVLGGEFEEELLQEAAGVQVAERMDGVEALRLRQVLEEAGAGRLRFVHDRLRELAYEQLPPEQRRAVHHRAADLLERRHPGSPELASAVALHWSRALVPEKACGAFARAGQHARAAYANEQALAFHEAGLREVQRLLDTGASSADWRELRLELYEGMGDLLALMGRQEEARAVLEQALALCAPLERLRRARLLRKLGKAWEAHHHHEQAAHAYEAAEESLGQPPQAAGEVNEQTREWRQEWVQIQIDRAAIHYWQSQVEALSVQVQRIRPLVEAWALPFQRAHFFQALIQLSLRNERFLPSAETVGYAQAYLTASQAVGEPGQVSTARYGLATCLILHGALDEAEPHMLASLEHAERAGDVPLQASCLHFQAMLLRRRGSREQVRRCAERNLAVAQAAGRVEYVASAKANLAWVALREQALAEAEQGALQALELWRSRSLFSPFQWLALLPLISLDLARGRVAEALNHAQALLAPQQQRLPEEVSGPLRQALEVQEQCLWEQARRHLSVSIEAAQRMGYL